MFHFGAIEIDERRRQLHCRGTRVAIEPKPFELLVYLIRHRDRVVRRDELMQAIWPGITVSEATLSSAVRRARKAIGPERASIEGVRKVGYRFVGRLDLPALPPPAPIGAGATGSAEPTAPFVGRLSELAQLTAVLEGGLAGRGSFVVVAGEPGVGKSRTLAELGRRAVALGAQVLIGRCYEGEGGQAFWPWVQVFRSFAAGRDAESLRALLGAEAVDIARLTAAIAAAAPESPPPDPEMQRARLFDSAVAVLRRAARQSPLLVVLDDLHWADSASLMLLRALVAEVADVPLVLLGAYRHRDLPGDHPLLSVLTTGRREQSLQRVTLDGLPRHESAELLQTLAGAALEESLAAALFDATEGNPFFLGEYWLDLVEAGCVVEVDGIWRRRPEAPELAVPASAVEIIDRRLQRLSAESIQLLAIAAVIGRELDHELLHAVSPFGAGAVIDLLEQAARAGVIDEDARVPGRYRFAHALVRQTLYEGLSGLRRAALHRAVGETLEKLTAGAPGAERVIELAQHFMAAVPAGTTVKAIEYLERAAIEATRACAYDSAVSHLARAVQLASSPAAGAAVDSGRRCELQLAYAEALARAGDGARMRAEFEQAASLARAIPAPTLLARAAIGMTSRWTPADDAAVRLLEEALAALPASAPALRAETQARLAKTLYHFDGARPRREQLCAEARATAQRTGQPRILGEVLADSLEALFHSDTLNEQDELAAALALAAADAGDARLRLLAAAWHIVNSMRHGRLTEADRQLAEFSHMARDLRQPRFLHHAAAFDAALLLARGRLAEAELRIEEALRVGLPIDEAAAHWLHWGQLHHLRGEQGRFAEFIGEGLALRLPPATPAAHAYQSSFRWAAPHVFSELGREAEARASFEALLAQGLDKLPSDSARGTRVPALFSLGDTCITIGDAPAAGEIYSLLEVYSDQWHVLGWGSVVFASCHQMLGALAAVGRRWRAAAEHFEEALRQHRQQGAVCAEVRTLYQHARALRRRGRASDRIQADALTADALRIAGEHGLAGIAARLQR